MNINNKNFSNQSTLNTNSITATTINNIPINNIVYRDGSNNIVSSTLFSNYLNTTYINNKLASQYIYSNDTSGNYNWNNNYITPNTFKINYLGLNNIAIGSSASVTQPNNTIILNASTIPLTAALSSGFYVFPIRNNNVATNLLSYDPTTNEIFYSNTISTTGNIISTIGSMSSININCSNIASLATVNVSNTLTCTGLITNTFTCNGTVGSNGLITNTLTCNGTITANNFNLTNTAISLGYKALTAANNTIILNASGSILNGISGLINSFYVSPVRNNNVSPNNLLCYDAVNKEIYYTSSSDLTISTNNTSIGVGAGAGLGLGTVNVGYQAGNSGQNRYATSIGYQCGKTNQSWYATSVGYSCGSTTQGQYATAIGMASGQTNQGNYAIGIGFQAGSLNQPANTIILNASSVAINGVALQTNSLYIAPIRNNQITATNVLSYDSVTSEVFYTTIPPPTTIVANYALFSSSTPQSLTSGSLTPLSFPATPDSIIGSTGLTYNGGGSFSNNSGLTLLLNVSSTVNFDSNSTGARRLYLQTAAISPIADDYRNAVTSDKTVCTISTIFLMPTGQNFAFYVFQSSGGNLNVSNTSIAKSYCTICKLN